MDDYTARSYGDGLADVYDEWYNGPDDTDETVARVAELAGAGPVLELGAGTGRLAIPIAAGGRLVVALDASAAMLDHLRAKPGSSTVRCLVGDAAALPLAGSFAVVLAARNLVCNVTSAAGQQRLFAGAARVLRPGGVFAVEAFVPADFPPESGLETRHVTAMAVVLSAWEVDAGTGVVTGQFVELRDGGTRLRPWAVLPITFAALDGMAEATGFRLRERAEDWVGTPLSDDSAMAVSLYERA